MATTKSNFLAVSLYLGQPTINGIGLITPVTVITGGFGKQQPELAYDAATGLISNMYDSYYLPYTIDYVLGVDGHSLYPLISSDHNSITVQSGLTQDQVMTSTITVGESITTSTLINFIRDLSPTDVVDSQNDSIMLMGTNLWSDGLLRVVNPAPNSILSDPRSSFLSVTGTYAGIIINSIGTLGSYPLPVVPSASSGITTTLLNSSFNFGNSAGAFHFTNQNSFTQDSGPLWRPTGTVTWQSGNLPSPFLSGPYSFGFGGGIVNDINNLLGLQVRDPVISIESVFGYGGSFNVNLRPPSYDNWVVTVVATPGNITDGQVLASFGVRASGSTSGSGWVTYISQSKITFEIAVGNSPSSVGSVIVQDAQTLVSGTPVVVSFGRNQSGTMPYLTATQSASYFVKTNMNISSSVQTNLPPVLPWVNNNITTIYTWDYTFSYPQGWYAEYGSIIYVSLVPNNLNNVPSLTSGTSWDEMTSTFPQFSGAVFPSYKANHNAITISQTLYCDALQGITYDGLNYYSKKDWIMKVPIYSATFWVSDKTYNEGDFVMASGSITSAHPDLTTYISVVGANLGNNPADVASAFWSSWDLSPANTGNNIWGIIGDNHNIYFGCYETASHPFFMTWQGDIYEAWMYAGCNPDSFYSLPKFVSVDVSDDTLSLVHSTALSSTSPAGKGGYIAYSGVNSGTVSDSTTPITFDAVTGMIQIPTTSLANEGLSTIGWPYAIFSPSGNFVPVVSATDTGTIHIVSGSNYTTSSLFWQSSGSSGVSNELITVTPTRGDIGAGSTCYSPYVLMNHYPEIGWFSNSLSNGWQPLSPTYLSIWEGPISNYVPVTASDWTYFRGGWFSGVNNNYATFYTQGMLGYLGYNFQEQYGIGPNFQIIDDQNCKFMIPGAHGTPGGVPAWDPNIFYTNGTTYSVISNSFPYYYFSLVKPNMGQTPYAEWNSTVSGLAGYPGLYSWTSAPNRSVGFIGGRLGTAGTCSLYINGVGVSILNPW